MLQRAGYVSVYEMERMVKDGGQSVGKSVLHVSGP